MRIVFDYAGKTYVAYDSQGYVLGVYRPAQHGTLDEWKNSMLWRYLDREV